MAEEFVDIDIDQNGDPKDPLGILGGKKQTDPLGILKKKVGGQGVLSGAKTSLQDVGLEAPSTSGIDFSGLQKAANEGVTGEMMKAKPEVFSQQKIKPSFLNPQEAAKHLETKLKERKVKARPKVELATTQEEAVFRFPEDIKDNQLDRYDLNDIKDNLKDNWEKQAFDIYQKDRNKKASIEKYGISEEAALDYAASQGDKVAERMKYSPPVSKKKLESVVGSKMMDFLYDEDVMKIAEQNPEFAEQWRQNAETLYDKYPTVANKVVAQKIGQYREDSGRGGLLVDIPTKGGVDEVVEEMIANGKLTDKEKQIYQNELRPKIGVLNSIGRGFGNTFAPAFTNDAPIQTTDFLGSLQDSYKNTLRSTAHAIEDLNAASTGGLLSVDKEARLNDITDREYKTPTVEAKGTLSKAAQGGGHLVGFVVPMILGGEAKIPELASSALTFGGINEDAALRMFPDNQMKQAAYTALATGFDVFAGKYLLPKNILGDAKKEFSSEISKVINGFTDKTLTTEAAKKTALDIGEKIAKKYVPDLVKGNVKTATVLGGFNIFHNGVDAAFGGRDVSMDDVAHQAIEDFKTNLLAATPLTAAGVYGRYNKSAARGLREAASNIDYYKEKLQDDIALDPESAPQKTEALKNLEVAAKINNDVKDLPVTEKQKDKYVLHSVVENIWKQKADATTDTNLKEQYNQKAKDAKSVKEQILNGNTNEEIAPESEIKKQEEEEKRQTDLKRLEEDKKLADEKWKQKRSEVDGREGDAAKLKIKELEKEKERLDENYEKKVAEKTPEETIVELANKGENLGGAEMAIKADPSQATEALRFIAQQAHGITENGEPAIGGKAEIGNKEALDAALKKFPTPESTLQPKEETNVESIQQPPAESVEPIQQSEGEIVKPTVRVSAEQLEERQPSKIRERYIDDFNIVEDSSFMWRVTSQLSTADRKKAVADIKAGKDTAAARKLEAEIQETLDRGTVVINRGRGNNAETVEIPVDEWFQFSPIEQDRLVKLLDKMDENTISIINENDITLDNIDSLKHLFDGFPYEQSDLENIKTYLTKSSGSDKTRQLSEASEQVTPTKEQEVITEVGKPPTEPPTTEVSVEDGGGKPKSLLNRLMDATNLSETTKQGFREKGLKYEPQSHEEARKIAKEVVDNLGIEQAVTEAETNKLQGGVNSAVFAEALDRLYEQEVAAKTPQEKFELASKQAEIGIRFDEFLRAGGRDISQVQDFYKKSPLGVTIRENIKRKEDFENWSKPKEQSWKEFFEELRKEPEFEKLFKEKVKEELKTERAEARKARKEKVDKFFDEAKGKFEEGGAMYATIIPPKVITAAIEGMRKAYHAGEKVTELIQDAIDYISEKVGTWDSEKFRKEWEEKLKEKEPKRKELTDEELKARVLDKFRKKLKGLTEKQKDDVIRQAHKELINNGALEYDDFKKIIARVTGRGELSEADAAKLKELVAKTNELDAMAKRAREVRTPEALNDFKRTEIEVAKATRELNEIFYNKPDIVRRLVGVMQLNTLGIVSLINNPVYNIWNQMSLRFPVGVINDAIDRAWSGIAKLMGKNYQREYNVWETQKDFWQMLGVGIKESMTQLMTGLNRADYTQKELHAQQIRPFKAIRDLIAWKKGEKHLSKRQVMDKAIQATVGIPAEAVARLLNVGDKPQRFAAEGSQGAAFAKALGLKEMDKKLFMEFPREEAYREYKRQGLSDEAAGQKADYIRDAMIKEGERSTFQQDNLLNDAITSAFGSAFGGKETGLAALAKTLTISPYIKIPSNAFWSFYNLLNPEIAILQSMVHGGRSKHFSSKGQETKSKLQLREARYWMAHAIVGMAARAAVMALVQQGVFTPSKDKDDSKKERDATNFFERAGTTKVGGLNISNRWFGQWGMLGNSMAKKYYDSTPEQRENQDEFWNIVLGGMEADGVKELQNGVFSNSSAIFDAFKNGKVDFTGYGTNMINMMTNIIQPATIAQINRASLDEVPTSRGDSFLSRLNQQFAQRSALYRKISNTQVDKKRNIWGQKQPKGGNVISRMFGISKVDPQLALRPMYNDFLENADASFLPPSVSNLLNGQKLTNEQHDKLMEYIGSSRRMLVEPFVSDMAQIPGYDKLYSQIKETDERKRVLGYLYEYGRILGLEKFYQDYPQLVKPEKEEAQKELDEMYENFKKEIKNN